MPDKKRRVVIVEDHPMVREWLAQTISHEGDLGVCGEADEMRHGIELIRDVLPDLAIVDLNLKDSSGLDLIKELRAFSVETPVLVLSMHDEAIYAQRALRAGASGYISKERPAAEVLSAIRHVRGGDVYLSQGVTSRLLKGLHSSGIGAGALNPIGRLTDRELDVLGKIGHGNTTREIAETLHLGIATIDTYRARIKEKLNLQNATELLHFAIRWIREHE